MRDTYCLRKKYINRVEKVNTSIVMDKETLLNEEVKNIETQMKAWVLEIMTKKKDKDIMNLSVCAFENRERKRS